MHFPDTSHPPPLAQPSGGLTPHVPASKGGGRGSYAWGEEGGAGREGDPSRVTIIQESPFQKFCSNPPFSQV